MNGSNSRSGSPGKTGTMFNGKSKNDEAIATIGDISLIDPFNSAAGNQFKLDLSEQLNGQHAALFKEMQSFREDLFEFIQQEMQTIRLDASLLVSTIGHGAKSEFTKPSSQPCQGDQQSSANFIREAQKESPMIQDVAQWPQSPSRMSPSQETAQSKDRNSTSTTTSLRVMSTKELEAQPNLNAFMQAKNWQPPSSILGETLDDESPSANLKRVRSLKTALAPVVEATWFDLGVGAVIIMNAAVMALALEYDALASADAIGIDRDGGDWPSADLAFLVLEHIFTLFFLTELILKLIVYGKEFFKSGWNWLDLIIVALAVMETYILSMLQVTGPNISFVRLMRIFKMVKVLRIVRVLQAFSQLRVMLVAMVCSMPALVWSMTLLGIVQLIAAIFMTQSLQGWLLDDEDVNDQDTKEFVYQYFGSFSRSSMSIIEMTLAPGTWARFGRVITYKVHGAYWVFFFAYAVCVSFAMIRVITALFLKETLNAAAKDNEMVMAEVNKNPEFIKGIRKVFNETDLDQSGHLSLEELETVLRDDRSTALLNMLGIQMNEVLGLFTLMDDGDDEISFFEFLSGVMRVKAKGGVDLATLLYENKKILTRLVRLEKVLNDGR